MKIRRLARLMAMLMVVSVPFSASAFKGISYGANYDFSNLTIGSDTLGGVTYLTVNYNGLYNGGEPGTPSLPIDYIRFSVPWNAVNFSVRAQLRNTVTQDVYQLVYPCQPPRLMSDTTPLVITPPDSSAYFSNNYFPAQSAWVVDEGFLAGENHIVTVAVMPVSFRCIGTGGVVYNQLRKAGSIVLTLDYQLSDSLAMYPIVRQDSTLRQEGYALTRSMVVNPDNVEAYATGGMVLDTLGFIIPNSGDGLNGGVDPIGPIADDSISNYGGDLQLPNYPYLIVTTSELYHSVRRIAALKRQKGYNVKVVTIGDVMNDPYASQGDLIRQPNGTYLAVDTTRAGILRQYLKKCFRQYDTQYVLLVGDSIPYKTVPNTYDDINGPNATFDLISDLYYGDLSADWDSLTIDYNPELYVGRILSQAQDQIDNYTDKLFRYELNPGDGDYSYLKNSFFSRGREFYTDFYYPSAVKEFKSVFPNQFFINDTTGNNSKHPNGTDIINALNSNRVGFACIYNHGDSARILVYGKDIDTTMYFINASTTNNDGDDCLSNLTNKQYPMIFYAPICVTIPFDYTGGTNFGEAFTTGKDYGGPVYIGYTRAVINIGAAALFQIFAKKIKAGYYKLGVADALSKNYRSDVTYNEVLSHAYLGDTELELWTDEPQQFTGIAISREDNSINITGIGMDAIPTTIAYYCMNSNSSNGYYRKVMATTPSVTLDDACPNSTIMLYKHNYIPYIAPLKLQNVDFNNSQYVIASDVTAGSSVDNKRTPGDVVVKNGVEYEIEASGTVTLQGGFTVEKGATFAVYPSSF